MKEAKKHVAKFYYRVAKMLFTMSLITILGIIILCTAIIELSDMTLWGVIIILMIAGAVSEFYASIKIQKFLFYKGYLNKDEVIFM